MALFDPGVMPPPDPSPIDPHLPTAAPAGSDEKIELMRARYLARLPLFDPRDSKEVATAPAAHAAGHEPRDLPRGVSRFRGRYRARYAGVTLGVYDTAEEAREAWREARARARAKKAG